MDTLENKRLSKLVFKIVNYRTGFESISLSQVQVSNMAIATLELEHLP